MRAARRSASGSSSFPASAHRAPPTCRAWLADTLRRARSLRPRRLAARRHARFVSRRCARADVNMMRTLRRVPSTPARRAAPQRARPPNSMCARTLALSLSLRMCNKNANQRWQARSHYHRHATTSVRAADGQHAGRQDRQHHAQPAARAWPTQACIQAYCSLALQRWQCVALSSSRTPFGRLASPFVRLAYTLDCTRLSVLQSLSPKFPHDHAVSGPDLQWWQHDHSHTSRGAASMTRTEPHECTQTALTPTSTTRI